VHFWEKTQDYNQDVTGSSESTYWYRQQLHLELALDLCRHFSCSKSNITHYRNFKV